MECYVIKDRDMYKGFPIVSEASRKTAEEWARNGFKVDIPEELKDCGVDDFDDRLNNKIFKVYFMTKLKGKEQKLYFDMYVPAMLEVMKNGIIEKGIIKVPLLFIDRTRLVMFGGELHQDYLKRKEEQAQKKADPKIPIKELVIGGVYTSSRGGKKVVFAGKVPEGYYVIKRYNDSDPLLSRSLPRWDDVCIIKSPSFKQRIDESYTIKDLIKYADMRENDFKKEIIYLEDRKKAYYSPYINDDIAKNREKLEANTKFKNYVLSLGG